MDTYKQLELKLNDYGAKCRMVSIDHIRELKSAYNKSIKDSLIDRQFTETYINSYIDFTIKEKYPSALSLIIIATPSPQVDLKFKLKGKDFWLKIPPTYSDRVEVTGRVKKITSEIFDHNDYHTFPIVLPKKLIAVKSGLAKYGKNNLAYVKGMGSYNRLTLFATDLPCENDSWQKIQMLDRCKKCFACQKICPTSAIVNDRFVIKSERCLTYFNEQSGQFPEWIDPSSHNCVIGCLKCQEICPENKRYYLKSKFKEEFNERETNLILNNIPYEELPEELQTKISNLCLTYYYKHLLRNISPLIENQWN